jgi:hypothetical protein
MESGPLREPGLFGEMDFLEETVSISECDVNIIVVLGGCKVNLVENVVV